MISEKISTYKFSNNNNIPNIDYNQYKPETEIGLKCKIYENCGLQNQWA